MAIESETIETLEAAALQLRLADRALANGPKLPPCWRGLDTIPRHQTSFRLATANSKTPRSLGPELAHFAIKGM
jgi:hypothetical protein